MNLEKDIANVAAAGLDMRTRLIIWLSALVGLIVAGIVLVAWAEHRGAMLERVTWQKKEAQTLKDVAEKWRQHAADDAAERERQITTNLKVTSDHEKELEALRDARAADRVAVDRAGGLRVTHAVCDSPAAAPEAAGAGGRDEASASTVRLPESVENDLWAIVNDADEVSAQLRSCQAWIVANGFYGPIPAESMPLLDRMVSAQNHDNEAQHATDDR